MSDFEVINNTNKARGEFGYCYGSENYTLSKNDIEALLNGKCLATTINCGEYSIFITLNKEEK